MPNPELVARVDGIQRSQFAGEAFRNHGPGYGPLDTGGSRIHGGRWNPKESFPVLYLGLSPETAVAEFYRLVERQGRHPSDLLPRRLTTVDVALVRVLDLTVGGSAETLGLHLHELTAEDPSPCQAVGDAAHYLGFEAVKAPSATGTGEVLAVFWDKVLPGSRVVPVSHVEWQELPPRL